MQTTHRNSSKRRGIVAVLVAILLVFLLAMVAFAVDIGYIALVKNQLQVAADAAAHAAAGELSNGQTTATDKAKSVAGLNIAGSPNDFVSLADQDVELGIWNSTNRTFTSGATPANAVRVTARRTAQLFFAPVLGIKTQDLQAQAIAVSAPRDIAFIIDLSGSMNNDSELWATNSINSAFTGYPTIGSDLMADVFTDFGFGSYPGTQKHVGEGSIPTSQLNDNAYTYLANTYLMNNMSVASQYRTLSSNSSSTRKTKTYKWIIDYQLASIMPNAKPTPSSSTNLAYWTDYLDYIVKPKSGLPPNQNSYQISGAGNPYADAWPNLTSSSYSGYYNKLGYLTYVQFMMDYGWNKKAASNSTYSPLSRLSADCPWRYDSDANSPGYGLSFPPREQPTHAARLAVMAAINKIKQLNTGLSETVKDHLCVISFDTASGCTIRYPLSTTGCDYEAARASARDMQAVADDTSSTASENGLIMARNHLDPNVNPNGARANSNKILIFLSDGIPNIKQSSSSTISSFMSQNTGGEWFNSGSYQPERNAVLMQVMQLEALGWKVHAVGVGLGADRSLMDRMARASGTGIQDPNNPTGSKISPYADGNPADYQDRLTSIFNDIVVSKSVTIVK